MKIKEKHLVERFHSVSSYICWPTPNDSCKTHVSYAGKHFVRNMAVVQEDIVVDRPLTECEIVSFASLSPQQRINTHPDFISKYGASAERWLNTAIKEHFQSKTTDTKADPMLISEPLKASSSSDCNCNHAINNCKC